MVSSKSPTILPENVSTQPVLEFDYEDLDIEIRVIVQQRTSEIKNLMRRTSQEIIEMGQKLVDVKYQLGHGNFRSWLKAEFDWSVQTATRFIQVAENFQDSDLTLWDIAASALYLLASPSILKEARAEALQRASLGEKITYTKAKEIICKHQKAVKQKNALSVNVDVPVATFELESNKFIEVEQDETLGKSDALLKLTEKEVETETPLRSSQDLVSFSASKDKYLVPTVEINKEELDNTTLTPASKVNQAAFSQKTPNLTIVEIEIGIKKLTPEQLALLIMSSAKNGLSESHLEAIILAAQQALNEVNRKESNTLMSSVTS
ncbi:MAG: DUF3102 domain-containing protein [Tolypothrix brevis GSE-NOS-MK-07-07A]|jgi:hypothetical protein|nr:DUF3102 domain-containing protein [Tolypothrix brevis GSE-NOS-MK-07-07A]